MPLVEFLYAGTSHSLQSQFANPRRNLPWLSIHKDEINFRYLISEILTKHLGQSYEHIERDNALRALDYVLTTMY